MGIEAQAVLVSLGPRGKGSVSGTFAFDVQGGDGVRGICNMPVDPVPEIGRTYPIVRDAVYPMKFVLGTLDSLDVSAVRRDGRRLTLTSVGFMALGGSLVSLAFLAVA